MSSLLFFLSIFLLFNLGAFAVEVGEPVWTFETGAAIRSSPALGRDGTLYVGSEDKKIYAIDGKTGAKKWEFLTGDKVLSSPALGTDGTLYCGSHDKKIYAIDGKTGARKWEFETGGKVYSSPAVGKGNLVLIGSADGRFYALKGETGELKWQSDPKLFSGGINSSAALAFDDTLFVGGMDKKT